MSAPALGKGSQLTLPDFSSVNRLPKPVKALVYLAMLTMLTLVGIAALGASVLVIGELSGSFDLSSL